MNKAPPSLAARRLVRRGSVVVVVIVALIWPALYNGQPFFHTDTSAYLRGADAGMQKLTHHTTVWSLPDEIPPGLSSADRRRPEATTSVSSVRDKTVLSGRSPLYGLLLYLGEITGGFWVSVMIQAAAVGVAIALAVRAAGLPTWPLVPLTGLLLAAASSAPFYTSFLMPDIFAGVLILANSVLLAARSPLRRSDYVIWFVLCVAAATFHASHLIIAIGMLCLGMVWNVRQGWGNWRGLLVMSAAILTAIGAQVAVDATIERIVGAAPQYPPFLVARLVDDGPGYRYLRATCPSNGLAVCEFLERLPMSATDFLWSPNGVFSAAKPEIRRRLAAEQKRFALAVLEFDPAGVLRSALSNALKQATLLGLENFQIGDTGKRLFERKIPVEHMKSMRHSAAYNGEMPTRTYSIINATVLLAAALLLAWLAIQGGVSMGVGPVTAGVTGWMIVGIVLDVVVCGVLSSPLIRYSERVQWLVPLAAIMVIADRLWRAPRTWRRDAHGC
jgi:hypothetical protein